MIIKVLTFGVAKEICGSSLVYVETEDELKANVLRSALLSLFPELGGLVSFMIAVNGKYALPDTEISSDDEVAIIPPVSGG